MRLLVSLSVLFLTTAILAQEKTPGYEQPSSPSWIPRPMIFLGPSLVGNGYQNLAADFGGGLLVKSKQLVGDFEASYMNANKNNDATLSNGTGYERFLHGRAFIPWKRGFYFGGGAQWSQTSTANYAKKAWRPTFGVGQDYFTEGFNTRWQVLYVTKGSDRSNAVQGPEIQFWLPTPASKTHFFYRQTTGVYEFHTTTTNPLDSILVARQTRERHLAVFVDFTFGWKF
jgi:hypothetical protein